MTATHVNHKFHSSPVGEKLKMRRLVHLSSILFCLSLSTAFQPCRLPSLPPFLSTTTHRTILLSTSSSTAEDENTVVTLQSPSGQKVTLVGTAHLSEKSNDQVQRIIETVQPNVVMVELDPSRLHRIGIESIDDIQIPRVTTSEDIQLPILENKQESWFMQPLLVAKDILVGAWTRMTRALLTQMYNDMGEKMNAKEGGGGEFLRAIRTAENCTACDTLVLGDRSSITTIQRAANLALESGDPLGVLKRLQQANVQEMDKLEVVVREELRDQAGGAEPEESTVTVAMMERLKQDTNFRNRIFSQLERDVPEFTQAFLKERDYLMGESIRRELERPGIKTVVGVVGLAHVRGMAKHLEAVFSKETVPLVKEFSTKS